MNERKLRTLEPKALSFISLISHTPKEEFRCYTTKPSFPDFGQDGRVKQKGINPYLVSVVFMLLTVEVTTIIFRGLSKRMKM